MILEAKTKPSKFRVELILGLVIFLLPFLIHLHLFASDDTDVIEVFNWSYEHVFYSNQVYFWYILSLIIPLILLGIWYSTTYNKWRILILLPFNSIFTDLFAKHLEIEYSIIYWLLFSFLILLAFLILESTNRIFFLKLGVRVYKWDLTSLVDYNFPKKFYIELQEILPSTDMEEIVYLKNLINTEKIFKNSRFKFFRPKVAPDLSTPLKIFTGFILITSFVIYHAYILFPPGVKSLEVGPIILTDYGFIDITTFMFTFLPKIAVLLCLVLWFLVSKYWWRYAILCPITIIIIQISELFSEEVFIDTYNTLKNLPGILVILAILVFISTQIKYRYKLMDIYNLVNSEINKIISRKGEHSSVILKETLEKLKKSDNESELSAGLRLQRLLALKEEIQRQINKKD